MPLRNRYAGDYSRLKGKKALIAIGKEARIHIKVSDDVVMIIVKII